jgi:CheY-like chemotaxis protein
MEKSILLAEDSPDDELFLKKVLERCGIENPVCGVVRDGREAIAYIEGVGRFSDRSQYPVPEILFLDLKMPGADGYVVLEWLKTRPDFADRMLIVVLTHLGEAQAVNRAYELGADSFLTKPLNQPDLENLIFHFSEYWIRSSARKPLSGPTAQTRL